MTAAPGAPPAADLAVAHLALERYPLPGPPRLRFVRHGENTIFRVDAGGAAYALRVHRPGYQTAESLRSEFAWTQSLSTAGLRTAPPVTGRDGAVVQAVESPSGPRLVSLVGWMDGVPLAQIDRLDLWRRLGELTATMHLHSRAWRPPPWFTRRVWDVDGLVGERPIWGDPLELGRWSDEEAALLRACRGHVRRRLADVPRDRGRFGLIHADLSFENVLVRDDGSTALIDFDDGGYGWFLYDLAVSLFPFEDRPGFASRRDALVSGYRSVAPLAEEDIAGLPAFLMARRLVTLGWTFTRAATQHARAQRAVRLARLRDAAERFLGWAAA